MESRYKRDHGYSYGEMIQKQDALTVSELTEGVFSEWDDKLEIMGSICDFYDYMWRFYPDGRLVLADTILYSKDVKNCEWKGKVDCGHLEYHSLDDMLSDCAVDKERNRIRITVDDVFLFSDFKELEKYGRIEV